MAILFCWGGQWMDFYCPACCFSPSQHKCIHFYGTMQHIIPFIF